MSEPASGSKLSIGGLILVPALITLAITMMRLVGELQHLSPRFFSAAPGGGGAIVGISWLPFLFGPYFAVKLARSGQGASGVWKTFGLSLLGFALMIVGGFIGFSPQFKFPGREILGILLMVVGPTLVTLGWPALFKVLVAYGYAARIPVAILMFFALRGHWGTHYDVLPPNYAGPTAFFGQYMFIAFLPQMVIWIAFTVLVGTIVATSVAIIVGGMNWYLQAWKKYAVFSGRARREEYWYFVLLNILIAIMLDLIDALTGSFSRRAGMGLLSGIYALAVLIPGISIAVRRLHDISRSGWWLLFGLIPLIGPIVLIVFLVSDSKPEQNQYGPSPKGIARSLS